MSESHFLYPSTLFVSDNSNWIITILGSCVAVCLHDPVLRMGGMNHYMLPYWNGNGLASPKFGNIAIEKLIDEMLKRGSKKSSLKAKVFGGGRITSSNTNPYNISQRNISIAETLLTEHGIPVISSSVGGNQGRKIQLNPVTGEVLHKFIVPGKYVTMTQYGK